MGDLDRVIQVNGPPGVAAFLQRIGQTGRHAGNSRNCLFVALNPGSLMLGDGPAAPWSQGYVEPVAPRRNRGISSPSNCLPCAFRSTESDARALARSRARICRHRGPARRAGSGWWCRPDPQVKVLTQLPGVSPFTALVILAEIGDVSRFGSARKLASWAGLTPTMRGSDRVAHYGHIGRGPVSRRVAFIPGIPFPPGDSQSECVTPRLDLAVR